MHNAERYARQHADVAQQRYTKYHNITTKDKMVLVGDQVVVLEKDSTHKTFARWKQGKITKVRSPHSYMVEMANGSCKHLHVNKIRLFVARAQNVGIISEQDVEFGEVQYAPFPADRPALQKPSERIDRASLYHLTYEQQDALLALLDEFSDVFSKTPGLCKVVEHEIRVTPEFRPRITKAYLKILKEKLNDKLMNF